MLEFELILGHLVGDYLLQNNWMALNKHKNNFLGWFCCTVHCLLYSVAVCGIMNKWSYIWFGIVFLSHFIFDKFGLADKYLTMIKGRSLKQFSYVVVTPPVLLQAGFTAFVYAVVDNTFHILIMWLALKYI